MDKHHVCTGLSRENEEWFYGPANLGIGFLIFDLGKFKERVYDCKLGANFDNKLTKLW